MWVCCYVPFAISKYLLPAFFLSLILFFKVMLINDEEKVRVEQLEKLLLQAREDLRSINKEHQAATEKLKIANKELQAANKELKDANEALTLLNRKLTNNQNLLNNARLYSEAIVATVRESLVILDKNLRIRTANESFYKKFSLKKEEVEGQFFYDIANHQWDNKLLNSLLLKILPQKASVKDFEITLRFPAGLRHMLVNGRQIINETTPEQLILLAIEDITDRTNAKKETEASEIAFREIANNIPAFVWKSDRNGNRSFFNSSWYNFTGRTFEQDKNMGWTDDVFPHDLEMFLKKYNENIQKQIPFEIEYRLRRYDGKYIWTLCKAIPMRDVNGIFSGLLGVCVNINEQKTREQKKDEFISIASHEMKTPLTTCKVYLQMLEDSINLSDEKVFAKKASLSIDKLNSLINELLDVSKIQNGKLDYHITTFDFNKMIDTVVEDVQQTSAYHTIIKSGKVDKNITGDKDRIEQVVINLLNNAIKYSPGKKEVYINVSQEKEDVKVAVKDKGIGISSHNLEKIFDRYYRVEDHSIQFQGLGIGLYISCEIIKRHHGKIWAESEWGKGSTFYFTLPLKNRLL
jgi:two-component system CheB/CheR fusion protein